jgi:hypothetical protein
MPACSIEGCTRAPFHDTPPLCLQHTIEADPNARVEVSLASLVDAENDPEPDPDPAPSAKRRTTTS